MKAPSPDGRPTFISSYADANALPASGGPIVAFVGRSNAGKSSLINTLAGVKNLARTSKTPGRTRLINLFQFEGFRLADLPGYGYAKAHGPAREAFQQLVFDVLDGPIRPMLVVMIVDARVGLTHLDLLMHESLTSRHLPHIIAANKIDGLSGNERLKHLRNIADKAGQSTVLPLSAQSGAGRGELLAVIHDAIRRSG